MNLKHRFQKKLCSFLFTLLVRLQYISLKTKVEPTAFNQMFVKALILFQAFQELKLISFNSSILKKKFLLMDSILSLQKKYTIDQHYFDYDLFVLNITISYEIVYFVTLTILYFDKKEKFQFLLHFYKYFSIIYHNILLLPTIQESFYYIIYVKYLGQSITIVFLRLFHTIFHCLSCAQNQLVEIETCYRTKLTDLFNFSIIFLVCFLVQSDYQYLTAPIVLLLGRIYLLNQRLHNHNYLSWFFIITTIFQISYVFVLIIEQAWYDLALVFLFLTCIIRMIRLRKLGYQLQQSGNLLFKFLILKNIELQKNQYYFHKFFCAIKKNSIENIEEEILKSGSVSDKIKIYQYTYQFKKILLYSQLINLTKTQLKYWHKLNLEANIQLAINYCQNSIQIPSNIKQFAYALLCENESFELILKLLEVKQIFYRSLAKNNSSDNYMMNFKVQLKNTLIFFEQCKKQFETCYDMQKGRIKNCQQSDFISINIIQAYLVIFYGDYFQVKIYLNKAKMLRQRYQDLLAYDRTMNFKLQKNEVLFVQQSLIKKQDFLLNCNNKRISQMFGDSNKIKQIKDLIAEFNLQIYQNLINQYFLQGYDIELPQTIYLRQDEFLLECDLYFFASISKDDVIVNNLFVLRAQPNDLIIFDVEGKIQGITRNIFILLFYQVINNSKNNFNINKFVKKGLIQYYVQDIHQFIKELSQLIFQSQMQQALNFSSKWNFPSNHKKFLEQTLLFIGDKNEDQNSSSQQHKSIYGQSIQKMRSMQLDCFSGDLEDEENILEINNIKIGMMKQNKIYRLQTHMKSSQKISPIPFDGSLEFITNSFSDVKQGNFILRFKQVEANLGQSQELQIADKQLNEKLEILDKFSVGLQLDYQFIQQALNQKKFFYPLKFIIVVIFIMIAVNIISLFVNYKINFDNMTDQQSQVTFLTMPQAMTFNIAANFIMLWNYYCVRNQLYQTSPKLEYIRKTQLKNYFVFWQNVHSADSLKLALLSKEFGYNNLTLTSFFKDHKEINSIEFLNYYDLMREVMFRQYKNVNFSNESTFNPEIFKTKGLVRQNMLQIYKYHNFVLDEVISETQASFSQFVEKSTAFSLYFGIVFLILLSTFFSINLGVLRSQSKLIRLLQYLNDNVLIDLNQSLSNQKRLIQQELEYDQNLQCISSEQNEKLKKNKQKQSLQPFIENYHESLFPLLTISLIIAGQFILFTFGSQMIANLYNYKYRDSLILTMDYLRLKSRLDSTVLIGELIKTEQFIPNNSMEYINQTESIEYFFNSVEVILNISNQVNDQLIITSAYNTTFQQRLIEIFNKNLCLYYSKPLSFCKADNTTLKSLDVENYLSFIDSGLFGITQSLSKLVDQEFTQEISSNQYDFEWSRSKSFLNSPIHYHLFLYYPMEIQLCFYYCYRDIFAETQKLSLELSDQIYIYLICASVGFALFTTIICFFWVKTQYQYLMRLKLLVILFPPQLISQKGFNKLLCSQLEFFK